MTVALQLAANKRSLIKYYLSVDSSKLKYAALGAEIKISDIFGEYTWFLLVSS